MTRHDADQVLGYLQHYSSREGRVLKMRRPREHSLADELCPPRKPIEPINGGWRDAFEMVASFVVIGGIYVAFIAWIAIASASQVAP
jgi:hypothetical protein